MFIRKGLVVSIVMLSSSILNAQASLVEGLSSHDWELSISFDSAMKVAITTKYPPSVLFQSINSDSEWSPYELLLFSGKHSDGGADVSQDGSKIYFSSNRPIKNNRDKTDADLWMSKLTIEGWQPPVHLGDELNSDANEFSPSVAKSGNIYFMKDDEAGFGGYDIYLSKFENGKYLAPVNLGERINSGYNDEDPFIDPEERFLIFMSQRPGDIGVCNLYVSFKESGSWSHPSSLGALVNSPTCDYSPFVASDGYLYFISYGNGRLNGKKLTYKELVHAYKSPGNGMGDIFRVKWSEVLDSINHE